MDLRPATPDDVPAITALVRAAYEKWVPLIGREPMPMQADYDEAVHDHMIDLLFDGKAYTHRDGTPYPVK